MNPPINVKLPRPTTPDANWLAAEPVWVQLNAEVRGHPGFHPLTIKFAYVFGIIHAQFESADVLLRSSLPPHVSVFPAYGLCASGVELLGRCLNGSDGVRSAQRDLRTGFNWLAAKLIDDASEDRIVWETSTQRYAVGTLVQLRHFASHGQATVVGSPPTFDPDLLNGMPMVMGAALENYWWELNNSDAACEALARADVLAVRSFPILRTWILFQGDGSGESITAVFCRFNWQAIA